MKTKRNELKEKIDQEIEDPEIENLKFEISEIKARLEILENQKEEPVRHSRIVRRQKKSLKKHVEE